MKAATALRAAGAERVFACAVHGVLSGPAMERLEAVADRAGDHHQHDPAHSRAGEVLQEDQAAVGGAAARPGDPQHSRRDVGEFVVRVVASRQFPVSSKPRPGRWLELALATGNWKLETDMASSTLQAEKRETRGKNEARRLRASGRIPAVVYGAEKGKATEISVDPKVLLRILHSESGVNSLIGLEGVGSRRHAGAGEGIPARSDHPQAAPRRLLPGRDGQDADGHRADRRSRATPRASSSRAASSTS